MIVSHRSEQWLDRCLASLLRSAADSQLEIVVVENGGSDASRSVVLDRVPEATWVAIPNEGFAAANNHGIALSSAPLVLLLNPDTEIVEGWLSDLVDVMDRNDEIGVIGVRQRGSDGQLLPTIRRFPSVSRWLGEAAGSERWPVHPSWSGERDLRLDRYAETRTVDWTVGSFMLVRKAALGRIGGMYDGFFLYYEEPDLCLRMARAGWRTEHHPEVTIIHYGGNEGADARHAAQLAYARREYMQRHFSHAQRIGGTAVLALGYGIRAVVGSNDRVRSTGARTRARAALATLLARRPAPPLLPNTRSSA